MPKKAKGDFSDNPLSEIVSKELHFYSFELLSQKALIRHDVNIDCQIVKNPLTIFVLLFA